MSVKKIQILVLCFATIVVCYLGWMNRYPIVYPDTGTYIDSGYRNYVPHDRTIFYGLFIRHVSLSASLWFVIIAQSFLLCYILYITVGMFFTGNKRNYLFVTLILFLSLTTGLSLNASTLMPDIFSPICVLCFINLLCNPNLNKWHKIFISVLFVFSLAAQLSSIVIFVLLFDVLILYFIYKKIKKQPFYIATKKIILTFSLLVVSLIMVPFVHFCFGGGFQLSKGSHVFMVNHLLEIGILEDYLEDNCATKNYKICQYKNQLGNNFMWREDSPLYVTGGWEVNEQEYKVIIHDILTTPKYLVLLSYKSVEYSIKQFFSFNTPAYPPLSITSAPGGQIRWHFKNTEREYSDSLQGRDQLHLYINNQTQVVLVLSSMLFLFMVFVIGLLKDAVSPGLKWSIVFVILHGILNSVVCANTSTIDDRFQNRIVWLLPFFAIIVLIKQLESKKNLFKKEP